MQRKSVRAVLADLEPMKEERQARFNGDRELERTLNILLVEYFETIENLISMPMDYEKIFKNLEKRTKITPNSITEFINILPSLPEQIAKHSLAGYFISALVQASYNQKNNGFYIDGSKIKSLVLCDLNGESDRTLEITLIGNCSPALTAWSYVRLKSDSKKILRNMKMFIEVLHSHDKQAGEGCALYLLKDGKEELFWKYETRIA